MKIALISTTLESTSETFIRRHRDLMDAEVITYYGGYPSTHNVKDGRFGLRQWQFYLDTLASKLGLNISVKERALTRSLKTNAIDLCYAEFGPNGVGVMNACDKLKIPLIVNFHGYDIHKTGVVNSYKTRYQRLFEIAGAVVAVSREMEKKLISLGCDSDKIHYLPCAPDDKFFNLRLKTRPKSLLAVGRFIDKKAPYLTLLSFKKVLKDHPDASLTMIGDGPLLTCCKNIAKSLNISNVVFTGAIDHSEVLNHFKHATIFVQHSVTDENGNKEGTPVSVMEANAAGIPVVSTLHAGIPDVIINGEGGLLSEEFDTDAMAENITLLLNSPENANLMGRRGREHIKSHLAPDTYKKELNGIIYGVSQRQ